MLNTTAAGLPITDLDIQRFEQRRGVRLPSDYKIFLLLRNGGRPERDLFFVRESGSSHVARINFFLGIGDPGDEYDIDWTLDAVAEQIKKGALPIAVTWRGNYLCLEVEGPHAGRIFFWDMQATDGEGGCPVANSFTEMVENLSRDERSPEMHKVS
jgi:hypothetical protein